MTIKPVNSILNIAVVLIILSIIPSCAFASENEPIFGHGMNTTNENFTVVKVNMLDLISKQIADLKSFYTNVNEASNATALQKVLSSHRPAHECMGTGEMDGFNLNLVENVTADNFTTVQKEIISSIQNRTNMLNNQINNTKVSQACNRTTELNERINELQNLSTKLSEASTVAELKKDVFGYMQTQAVNSIDQKIKHLQTKVSESKKTSENTTELSSRITELTTMKEKISGVKSLEDLKTILSSSDGIPEMENNQEDNPMRYGDPEEHDESCRIWDNSTRRTD